MGEVIDLDKYRESKEAEEEGEATLDELHEAGAPRTPCCNTLGITPSCFWAFYKRYPSLEEKVTKFQAIFVGATAICGGALTIFAIHWFQCPMA